MVIENYFFIKFEDETMDEAIESHSMGFKYLEEAVEEAEALAANESPSPAWEIYQNCFRVILVLNSDAKMLSKKA